MRVFNNFIHGVIDEDIDSDTTTFKCTFVDYEPSPLDPGQFFNVVLYDEESNKEIADVVAYNATSKTVTVIRGQQDTAPHGFTKSVSYIEERVTAGDLRSFFQRSEDSKNLNPTSLIATSVVQRTSSVQETANITIEGADKDRILALNKEGRPLYDGEPIQPKVTITPTNLPIGTMVYFTTSLGVSISDLPDAWAVCDGRISNGVTTPNLVKKFIRSINFNEVPLNNTTNYGALVAATTKTGFGGDHSHTYLEPSSTATFNEPTPTTLDNTQIPEHIHADNIGLKYISSFPSGLFTYRGVYNYKDTVKVARVAEVSTKSTVCGDSDGHTHGDVSNLSHTHNITAFSDTKGHEHDVVTDYEPEAYSMIVIMRVA